MDKETIYRLERQSKYFYPMNIPEFTDDWLNDIKFRISDGFEQCQKKFHIMSLAESGSEDDEVLETDLEKHIKLVKDECMLNGIKAFTRFKNKIDEVTFIPNDLNLYEDELSLQHDTEFAALKKELVEQKVFITCLQKELNSYKECESLLKGTEQLVEIFRKKQEFKPPIEIKEGLVQTVDENKQLAYTVLKNMKT